VPRFFVYLLMVVKYFLWRVRNDYRSRDDPPGAVSVIECVKVRVMFHLPLYFKRFRPPRHQRYFHRHWGANGVVGSLEGGLPRLRL